jgi:hypothetical protein
VEDELAMREAREGAVGTGSATSGFRSLNWSAYTRRAI